MLEEAQTLELEDTKDNGCCDAIATVALMSFVVLAVIHFIYTGGLPAFFEKIF